jgi:RND family efflux transporter MFP subunit
MKRRLLLALGAVVVLAVILVGRRGTGTEAQPPPSPTVLVATMRLHEQSVPATVTEYGSIEAGPGAMREVSAGGAAVVGAIGVVPGQAVAAGATLLTLLPDPQAVAALRQAETALAGAKANRAHVAALLAVHLATNADLAAADQTLNDAQSALDALRATGAGTVMAVVAPGAGIVAAVSAVPGSLVAAGSALVSLIGADGLVATAGVTPDVALSLQVGDPASIDLLATGQSLSGRVAGVSGMIDPQTGLTDITLALPAGSGAMPGAAFSAEITTGALHGFVVPRDAVQTDVQGDYVFQLGTGDIAHREAVRVLGEAGQESVLAPDLDTALPLVTSGAYQLEDGAAVRQDPDGAGP